MFRDHFGVIYLSRDEAKVYPATLLDIPAIGKRLGISTPEASRLTEELGLRWKGPYGNYTKRVPTHFAAANDYVVQIDNGGDGANIRWDWERLLALIEVAIAIP